MFKRGIFAKQCLFLLFLITSLFFLNSCQSVTKLDENGNFIPSYKLEESLNFEEVEEPYKYIFLRLYDIDYLNPFYIANILKFGINLTEVNDVQASHASINFRLTDDFYGLTSGGKFQLEKESCLDTKSNKFFKKVNPNNSTQLTYAIKVSEEDYYDALAMVEDYAGNSDVKYDVIENFKIAHFSTRRRFRTKQDERSMEDMFYPELDEDDKATNFVCSTFCAYILKENVDYIRDWFDVNEINYKYVGVSDLPSIPGVVELFSSPFLEYDIAVEAFIEKYPEFAMYYDELKTEDSN